MTQLRQLGKAHAQIHELGGPTFSWPECRICPPPWLDLIGRDLGQWLAVYTQRPREVSVFDALDALDRVVKRERLAWSTR